MKPKALLPALLLLTAVPAFAAERSLYWRSMDVVARLDAEGALHVTERQAMVFSGDWNGGERRFRLGPRQRLRFERLTRLDPDGRAHPLMRGKLNTVDRYGFTAATTLRWRSRLPSDPPFNETELVYLLEYTLEHVLVPGADGNYVLDHDLAFADRPGPIRAFRGKIELDPAWQVLGSAPEVIERANVRAGEGVMVKVPLRWVGAGVAPGAFTSGLRQPQRIGLLVAMALGLLAATITIYRHGRVRGLFDPIPPPQQLDPTWIQEHLLAHPPELVSAAWERKVGPNAVAATLARIYCSGKCV